MLAPRKWKWKWSHSVVSDSLRPHGLQPTRLLRPWDFPGKSTGVGFHLLLQGIFLTQGSNPGFLHCRQMLYHLSHQGSLKEKERTNVCLFVYFSLSLHSLVLVIQNFFTLSPELIITQRTAQLKLCTKDCIKTIYLAWGQFFLPENLLTNPVILKCILWEWVKWSCSVVSDSLHSHGL